MPDSAVTMSEVVQDTKSAGELDATRERLVTLSNLATEFASQELSARTQQLYGRDWDHFANWCTRMGLLPLPADVDTIRLYVSELASTYRQLGGEGHPGQRVTLLVGADTEPGQLPPGEWAFKPATIERRLAAIAWVHTKSGHPNLTRDVQVRSILAGLRRVRQSRPRRMKPLSSDDLRMILGTFDFHTFPDGVKAHRDALVLVLGLAGGRRRSELAALTVTDLERHPKDGLHLHVRRSKTDQTGQGLTAVIPYGKHPMTCGPCLRWRWIRLLSVADDRPATIRSLTRAGAAGAWEHVCHRPDPDIDDWDTDVLFPRLRPGGLIIPEPMSDSAIHATLKRRAAAAGFHGRYGSHSLRAGFVTEARRAGQDPRAVRLQTGHGSDATMDIYDREYTPGLGNAVHSLDL